MYIPSKKAWQMIANSWRYLQEPQKPRLSSAKNVSLYKACEKSLPDWWEKTLRKSKPSWMFANEGYVVTYFLSWMFFPWVFLPLINIFHILDLFSIIWFRVAGLCHFYILDVWFLKKIPPYRELYRKIYVYYTVIKYICTYLYFC
jgi:hypothetical protein